jgi:hypothetical protein
MPVAEWGLAWQGEGADTLAEVFHEALYNEEAWQSMRALTASVLPQERAAPKIAAHIKTILTQA